MHISAGALLYALASGFGALAAGTAKDMDMGAAARAFKKAANKDFLSPKRLFKIFLGR